MFNISKYYDIKLFMTSIASHYMPYAAYAQAQAFTNSKLGKRKEEQQEQHRHFLSDHNATDQKCVIYQTYLKTRKKMENTDLKGGSLDLQQPTTATAAPQQIMIIQQAYGNTRPNLAVGSFRGLGIGQLVCGIVLIIVAIIQITVAHGHDAPMDTFWNVVVCAIFFIITGSLGISAARTKNRCLIYATLVLSILSLLGGISLLPGTIIALVYAVNEWPAWISVCVITLVVAVTEMILAIIQMVDCCRAVCCGSQQQPLQAVYYYPQPYAQNQPMVPTEQPYMANQPMAPAGQPYMANQPMAPAGQPYMANQPMAPAGQPYMANQPMTPTGQVAYAPNQPVAATGQYYPQNPPAASGGEKVQQITC
ncbi:uncharacterized protein [Ptychodera flava]|uniref:uncharacterized protein n=1 Tax=Ptychodera flava TaxID=63121 RepID=UPI00396A2935